jgi:hypothetical protein
MYAILDKIAAELGLGHRDVLWCTSGVNREASASHPRRDETESFGGSRDSTCASSTVRPTPTVAYLAVE